MNSRRIFIAPTAVISSAVLLSLTAPVWHTELALAEGTAPQLAVKQLPENAHGLLAFTVLLPGGGDIYVLDLNTRAIRPVVTSDEAEEYPALSPDGSTLVYYRGKEGDHDLFKIGLESDSKVTRLTETPGNDEDPAFSPDGKWIAFHSARAGGQNVFVMVPDGSGIRQLTKRRSKNTVPRWSPDGAYILFSTSEHWPGWDVERLNVSTGEIETLTSGFSTSCRASSLPDGSGFIYSHGSGSSISLYEKKYAGGEDMQLLERPGKNYDATPTKDNRGLYFAGELTPGTGDYRLFYLDKSSKKFFQVLESQVPIRYLSLCESCASPPATEQKPPVKQ